MAGFHQRVEEHDSGKVVISAFDGSGALLEVHHSYREPMVAIVLGYLDGNVVSESYMVNNEPASQKRYEQARQTLPDMPAAGQASKDRLDELKASQKAEHTEWLARFKAHNPDPKLAQAEDAHVRGLIDAEDSQPLDAVANPNLLVYFDEPPGKKLLSLQEKLGKYGISQAWLIGVDAGLFDDANKIGCDGIAVALPQDAPQRGAFFIMADKAVRAEGFSAPMDNGQAFTYLARI